MGENDAPSEASAAVPVVVGREIYSYAPSVRRNANHPIGTSENNPTSAYLTMGR